APATKPVNAVTQRTVPLAVKHLDNVRRESPIRLGPRNSLIEIHEMALVDASRRGVDDHEHFGREILAPAIKNHARNMNVLGIIGMSGFVKRERRQSMLPIDDQEILLRLLKTAHAAAILPGFEAQLLWRKEQDRSRYGRLRHRRFIEVADGADLAAGKLPLECLFASLNFRDELRDIILFLHLLCLDLAALLIVKPADKTDFCQQFLRWIRSEIEHRILLPNLRPNHTLFLSFIYFRFPRRF